MLAEQSNELTRTTTIELLQSGVGFTMYKRIFSLYGEPMGFANGVFRVNDLMDTCLSDVATLGRYRFKVTEADGTLVYARPQISDNIAWQLPFESTVTVADRPWQLTFAPTTIFLNDSLGGLDELWDIVGIVLVLLLSLSVRIMLLKQKELHDSQSNYRLLVENQSDMIVKIAANGDFLYVSPSYCKEFGKTEEELLGMQFMPLVHKDDRALTKASLERITPQNPNAYHEQRALTKDGWRWIAWSNTGLFNKAGELQAITAVGRDISDIKDLKDRLAHI